MMSTKSSLTLYQEKRAQELGVSLEAYRKASHRCIQCGKLTKCDCPPLRAMEQLRISEAAAPALTMFPPLPSTELPPPPPPPPRPEFNPVDVAYIPLPPVCTPAAITYPFQFAYNLTPSGHRPIFTYQFVVQLESRMFHCNRIPFIPRLKRKPIMQDQPDDDHTHYSRKA